MRKRLLFSICLILVSINFTAAQESEDGWPIIERCVPEMTPPTDWTYPGVILATGWAGLHGIRAGLDTPYILAFFDWHGLNGYVLSPDKHWFAVTNEKRTYVSPHIPIPVQVNGIRVYDLSGTHQSIDLPWKVKYHEDGDTGDGWRYSVPLLKWWDSDHLLYLDQGSEDLWGEDSRLVLLNPFTQEISNPPAIFRDDFSLLLPSDLFALSPDRTRYVYKPIAYSYHVLLDVESDKILHGTEDTDVNWLGKPVWTSDSEYFLNRYEEEDGYEIVLDDRNGKLAEVIFRVYWKQEPILDYGEYIGPDIWSPGDRYFLLSDRGEGKLFLADRFEHQIIDLCVDGGLRAAWSPDGTMLAYSVYRPFDNDPVHILDLKRWQSYTVAYHDGSIIGWRAGD